MLIPTFCTFYARHTSKQFFGKCGSEGRTRAEATSEILCRSNSSALFRQIRSAIVSAEDGRHFLLQPFLLRHAPDAFKSRSPRFFPGNAFTVAFGDALNDSLIFGVQFPVSAESNCHEIVRPAFVVVRLKEIRHGLRRLALVHDLPISNFKHNDATRTAFTLANDHSSRAVFRPIHRNPFVIDLLEVPDGQWTHDAEWIQCDEVVIGCSGLRLVLNR